jgi:two-component system CheB/CheR fusion protein
LLRRIERRINVRTLADLPAYAAYVKQSAEEAQALLKDLLISVTNFFRDKKAFDVIGTEVLPSLFKNKTGKDQLRIWIAGCATGEEAYSVAMLCAEKTMDMADAPKIQLFATDIDENSLTKAREGYYTLNDTADVSPDRLSRFFNKDGDGYRIRRELRENIMFANHNFIKDPPFSRLDLITCRNVLIYLNLPAQERVMETFHFALKSGGYLFLGSSESVDGASDLYAAYNRDQHIFQSRQVNVRAYPVPESVPGAHFDRHKSIQHLANENVNKTEERISFGELHQQLLEEYAPPSLVVNEEYDVVHLTDKATKYLQVSGGEVSKNLFKLIKPELRLELRSAFYQAMQQQSAVEARDLKVNVGDKTETLNIHIRPVMRPADMARGYTLVLFETASDEDKHEILLSPDEPIAEQLERELNRLRLQLRSSSEQYEFQAEELKASNEELQSMNEELRSAAEELETSKEELQSINEELRTVNQELKVKIEEIGITTDNLQNLINSTDIGTIFLDRSFRVVLFTPSAQSIFNLIAADYGRPLSDITNKLEYNFLLGDAESVLTKLTPIEKEVRTKDHTVYLMRITPYRTDEDRIKGVVVSFINITESKKAEEAIAADLKATQILHNLSTRLVQEENSQVLYDELVQAAIRITNADAGALQTLDENTEELTMLSADGFTKKMTSHFARVDAKSNTSHGVSLATGERAVVYFDDPDVKDEDGFLQMYLDAGYLTAQSTPLIARSGKPIGMLSTHLRQHHYQPSERELRYLDLLARQAADFIEQLQARELLQKNMNELTRFNNAMVSRESKMIELKKEVNELSIKLNEPERYPLEFEN